MIIYIYITDPTKKKGAKKTPSETDPRFLGLPLQDTTLTSRGQVPNQLDLAFPKPSTHEPRITANLKKGWPHDLVKIWRKSPQNLTYDNRTSDPFVTGGAVWTFLPILFLRMFPSPREVAYNSILGHERLRASHRVAEATAFAPILCWCFPQKFPCEVMVVIFFTSPSFKF